MYSIKTHIFHKNACDMFKDDLCKTIKMLILVLVKLWNKHVIEYYVAVKNEYSISVEYISIYWCRKIFKLLNENKL